MLRINLLLLICGAWRQLISSPQDSYFGMVDFNYRPASVLWAYYLVDPWQQDSLEVRMTGKGLAQVARPVVQDLLSRMDRPIVRRIASGDLDAHPENEKDDLAAGIAFWTLQWKADAMHKDGWETLHKQAELFLLKASHEGDLIQQSFASLAYAYCPLRWYGDQVGSEKVVPPSREREARLDEHQARLIETYDHFKESVPERALRAAYQLRILSNVRWQIKEVNRWSNVIKTEFAGLHSWYSAAH